MIRGQEWLADVVRTVLDSRTLTPTEKLVAITLAEYASRGEHTATVGSIALRTRFARETVQRTIRRLERAEIVRCRRRGPGESNEYELDLGRPPALKLIRCES